MHTSRNAGHIRSMWLMQRQSHSQSFESVAALLAIGITENFSLPPWSLFSPCTIVFKFKVLPVQTFTKISPSSLMSFPRSFLSGSAPFAFLVSLFVLFSYICSSLPTWRNQCFTKAVPVACWIKVIVLNKTGNCAFLFDLTVSLFSVIMFEMHLLIKGKKDQYLLKQAIIKGCKIKGNLFYFVSWHQSHVSTVFGGWSLFVLSL